MDNFLDSLKKTEGESTPTFYEILGCGQNANVSFNDYLNCKYNRFRPKQSFFKTDQIITEFRAKALAFHPDKNSNKTECGKNF